MVYRAEYIGDKLLAIAVNNMRTKTLFRNAIYQKEKHLNTKIRIVDCFDVYDQIINGTSKIYPNVRLRAQILGGYPKVGNNQ